MKYLKKATVLLIAAAIFATVFSFGALAAGDIAYGAATVDASSLNVRSGPGTSYDRVTTLRDGTIVVVLEKTEPNWWKINYNGFVGYVSSKYLTNVLTAENFEATGVITGDAVRLRKGPSTDREIVGKVNSDTVLEVIGINNGWYKVIYNDQKCYVRSDYMEIVGNAKGTTAKELSEGEKIADFALQFLGYRYVLGCESPEDGFDCSGLVWYTYKNFGYSTQRTASKQYKYDGVTVKKSELQPGDLVFFSSNGSSVTHVGIYIGDDEFVHASTSNTGVIISNLTSAYYTRVWFGAKRIVK